MTFKDAQKLKELKSNDPIDDSGQKRKLTLSIIPMNIEDRRRYLAAFTGKNLDDTKVEEYSLDGQFDVQAFPNDF